MARTPTCLRARRYAVLPTLQLHRWRPPLYLWQRNISSNENNYVAMDTYQQRHVAQCGLVDWHDCGHFDSWLRLLVACGSPVCTTCGWHLICGCLGYDAARF